MSTRRPMGPRDLAGTSSIKVSDIESALERTLSQMSKDERPRTPSPQPPSELPRKRVLLEADNVLVNSSPVTPLTPEPQSAVARPSVEPLSIKKKSSVWVSGAGSPRKVDRELTRTPSLTQQEDENAHVTSQPTARRAALGKQPAARATSLADETWENVRVSI